MWVVCRPVWVSKACQLFLVPSRSSNPPLYPSKGCELGSVLRLFLFRCFLLGLTFEPFKELGVCQFWFQPLQIEQTHENKIHKKISIPFFFPHMLNFFVFFFFWFWFPSHGSSMYMFKWIFSPWQFLSWADWSRVVVDYWDLSSSMSFFHCWFHS